MSADGFGKEPLVEALVAEWAALDDLLGSLPADAWARPSGLPGWTVHDVVCHLIGTEEWLTGEPTPQSDVDVMALPHVHNEIAAANERWIETMRAWPPRDVLARFRDVVARRTEALTAMTQDDFDAPSWSPFGQSTYGRFMRVRLFDSWLHEQDIRDVVGQPGHEDGPCAELSFDEILAAVGFLVGKRADAPQGSSVTIELTGPVQRTVHVAVDGRATVVPELPTPATATVRMTSNLFARLTGGRVSPADHLPKIELTGDVALGERVARNLAFTI